MAKSKSPQAILRKKQDKLNWSLFGFLENLLVFCATKTRKAPKESHVQFRINSKVKKEGICILFKTDRGNEDPLLKGEGLKPDYLVLYATQAECIVTIIEMKGREQKNREHGIDQIKALRDHLRREVDAHLPHACKRWVHFQGILLTPYGGQVPLKQLDRELSRGFPIVPLQYGKSFELYPYIRTKLSRSTRYTHQELRHDANEFNDIEELLVHCALHQRIEDAFHAKRHQQSAVARSGIYINYARKEGPDGDYMALSARSDGACLAFSSADFMKKVETEVSQLGLAYRRLTFVEMSTG